MPNRHAFGDLSALGQLLDDFFGQALTSRPSRWKSEENGRTFTLEVPGYGPEDIEVFVVGDILEIQLKKGSEKLTVGLGCERDVDVQGMTAKVNHGILTVFFPKKKSAAYRVQVTS